ncbi:MAG: N-acetyltransferase [Lysobacterales bacterium]|nr:MAG: N-acetyltransferase [Xanthomonadales bacterium]
MESSAGRVNDRVILLETERVRLRRFGLDDVDRLVELDSDPEVMRWISYGQPSPRSHYEAVVPRLLAQYGATPLLGVWVAETRVDHAFVGWFHLRPDRIDPDEQELGYRLRRSVWGQGLATEVGRALVAHGFGTVGADKLSARALVGNAGSRRVMEKCGFALEREFTWPEEWLPGRSEDERRGVKYSLMRSQWQVPRA